MSHECHMSIAILMYSGILENSADRISMILLNSSKVKTVICLCKGEGWQLIKKK